MSDTIEFELADNAFDYVLSAAEHAKKETSRDLKYAILHLFAGIELLLKARLYAKDWTLIFANSVKADQKSLKTGDFKSVDFETSCERLERVVGITIEPRIIDRLNTLRRVRNRVQHFEIAIDMNEAQSLLAHGTSFVIDFTNEHLPELLATREKTLEAIHEHLSEFEHFVTQRLKAIGDDLDAAATKIECPRCRRETLIIGDYENPKCPFCAGEFDAEELAEISESARAERCPTCGRESASLQLVGGNDGELIWFCYGCGESGQFRRCFRCDNLMWEVDGPCSTCTAEWMGSND